MNINEIIEIVQVFSYHSKVQIPNKVKINDLSNFENSSNDYVVVVL